MLEQYGVQYSLNWTTLRAPWIMEKDDFRFALSFGDDQFGGPDWGDYISAEQRKAYHAEGNAPLLLAADGKPLKRNFIHVSDLVEAMMSAIDHPAAQQQLFNIAMTEPVDYGVVAEHLQQTRQMRPVEIASPLHSNLLDNAKARLLLGWSPKVDTADPGRPRFRLRPGPGRRAQSLVRRLGPPRGMRRMICSRTWRADH